MIANRAEVTKDTKIKDLIFTRSPSVFGKSSRMSFYALGVDNKVYVSSNKSKFTKVRATLPDDCISLNSGFNFPVVVSSQGEIVSILNSGRGFVRVYSEDWNKDAKKVITGNTTVTHIDMTTTGVCAILNDGRILYTHKKMLHPEGGLNELAAIDPLGVERISETGVIIHPEAYTDNPDIKATKISLSKDGGLTILSQDESNEKVSYLTKTSRYKIMAVNTDSIVRTGPSEDFFKSFGEAQAENEQVAEAITNLLGDDAVPELICYQKKGFATYENGKLTVCRFKNYKPDELSEVFSTAVQSKVKKVAVGENSFSLYRLVVMLEDGTMMDIFTPSD